MKNNKTKLAPPQTPHNASDVLSSEAFKSLTCENIQLRPRLRLGAYLTNAQRAPAPRRIIPKKGA